MPVFLSMYAFSLLGFIIHFFNIDKKGRTKQKAIDLLLLYQLVFSLGMTSLLAFIGLTFMQEYIAAYTGWPACPFQQELGNVNLSFGILGILCIWLRGNFWTATVLGFSIWILGDAIQHISQIVWEHNYSPGNIGIPLITDIAIPVLLLVLMYLQYTIGSRNSRTGTEV